MQRIVRDEALRELGGAHGARRDEALAVAIADEVVLPRDQLARGVEAGLEVLPAAGAIVVVLHVVLAGPEQLHGDSGLLGEVRGFDDVVVIETTAETAAAP